jgi:hypothetical protein
MNNIFISYRRHVSWVTARLIYDHLKRRRINVFMDLKNLDTGQFDTKLLYEISVRPYFIVILEPGSLDCCANPGDWLRREIEYALALDRRIIPVMAYDFKFEAEDNVKFLTGKLAILAKMHGLNLLPDHFDGAITTLSKNY